MTETLTRLLNDFLGAKPQRRANPDYGRFRRFALKHRLAYKIASDGFIEVQPGPAFPRGLTTPHYAWGETLERLEHCLANPDAIDAEGHYSE